MEPRSDSFVHSGASMGAANVGKAGPAPNRQDVERRGRRLFGTLTREAQSLVARLRNGNADNLPGQTARNQEAKPLPVLTRSAAGIRLMIRLRNSRATIFGEADLFHDPAWDILIDLYAADLEGRTVPLTSASIASMVPPSTATRWITLLETRGLVRKSRDVCQTRPPNLELTDKARAAIGRFIDIVEAGLVQHNVRG